MVIPFGDTDFPAPTDQRVAAAKERGADCYVVVELSGDGRPAVITAESYDLLSEASAIAPAAAADLPTTDGWDPDWSPVVSLVAKAYGKAAGAAPTTKENP